MRRVLDLAVQPQTVPSLGAVGAERAREGSLARVHAHVLHQLVGRAGQVTAAVAPVLVALAMTLEVDQQLLLPWKRPLANAAAMGARLRLGFHGNSGKSGGAPDLCSSGRVSVEVRVDVSGHLRLLIGREVAHAAVQ